MAVSAETIAWLEDLFAAIDGVSVRRMFGGAGVFRQGLMFALAPSDGGVALKADAQTAPAFAAEGSREWVYDGKGKPMRMGYWHVPERLYDDAEEFRRWALDAFDAARRIDAAKPASQRKWTG